MSPSSFFFFLHVVVVSGGWGISTLAFYCYCCYRIYYNKDPSLPLILLHCVVNFCCCCCLSVLACSKRTQGGRANRLGQESISGGGDVVIGMKQQQLNSGLVQWTSTQINVCYLQGRVPVAHAMHALDLALQTHVFNQMGVTAQIVLSSQLAEQQNQNKMIWPDVFLLRSCCLQRSA